MVTLRSQKLLNNNMIETHRSPNADVWNRERTLDPCRIPAKIVLTLMFSIFAASPIFKRRPVDRFFTETSFPVCMVAT